MTCSFCGGTAADGHERKTRFGLVLVECGACWLEAGDAAGRVCFPALEPVRREGREQPGSETILGPWTAEATSHGQPSLHQVASECAPGNESDPVAWAIDTLKAAAGEGEA